MTINVELSQQGIADAIRQLQTVQSNLEQGASDLVDILLSEGEQKANEAYGTMATAMGQKEDKTIGHIGVSAEDSATAYIAEFGAGDDTMTPMFENDPGVPVYPGSYSELVGSGEYITKGYWHFGGKKYRTVKPRAGLLKARDYIKEHAVNIAKEVIQLD